MHIVLKLVAVFLFFVAAMLLHRSRRTIHRQLSQEHTWAFGVALLMAVVVLVVADLIPIE